MLFLPRSSPWSWGLFLQPAFTVQLGSVHLQSSTAPGAVGAGVGMEGLHCAFPVVTSQAGTQRMLLSYSVNISYNN